MGKQEKIKQAEKKIQRILLDLEDDIDKDIDHVRIDTDQFANLKVKIFTDEIDDASSG